MESTGSSNATTLRRERRVVRAVGFVPSEAKLHAVAPRDGLSMRGELVDRLREAANFPVVSVTGPPGQGKTTLISQWDEEDRRPFAWLTLDDTDNDPAVLITYLMLALQRVEPVDAGVLASLASGEAAFSTVVLPRLGRMLRRRTQPFVLVLDDADALTAADAIEVVRVVVDNLPEGSQLTLVGRTAPELPLHHLRAQRRLFELGTEDLRLTPAEGSALMHAAGLELSRDEAAALLRRTEGWAAGLYLAALSLQSALPRRPEIEAFRGDDSLVAGYLRDELLAGLPPARQTFLLRVSVLDRMCGPLCDSVLETSGSGALLRELAESNLFVVPLDRQDRWYRFHQLFTEMLRSELHRREPRCVAGLHSRASRWLEGDGDIEEAIAHAQAAGEVERAAHLVWTQVAPCLVSGRRATLERWLERFSTEEVLGHSRLALTAAWCAVERGRPVDHWLAAAERGTHDAGMPGETESVASAIALLHAVLARHGVVRMRADAQVSARLQTPDDPWRTLAYYLQAVALHLTGERETARRLLEETEQLAGALSAHSPRALAMAQLALLAVEDNDWDRADSLTGEALTLLQEHGLAEAPSTAPIRCMSTMILAKRGHSEAAKLEARRSMRLLALVAHSVPWAGVQSRYLLARAHLMLGDTAAARVLLSEAQTQLATTTDAIVLREALDAAWHQVESAPLGLGGGLTTLTTAELRVLQYLPTHLSFEQIGQRLFVSRNTVKTQAIAAYRKLGVSSRSEAVERALALGLIEN